MTDHLDNLVQIARFKSAAEAGYFADELHRNEQIPAEVAVEEVRESMHAAWSVRFALMVPKERAEAASLSLKKLIEQSNPADAELGDEFGTKRTSLQSVVEVDHDCSPGDPCTAFAPERDRFDFEDDSSANARIVLSTIVLVAAGGAFAWFAYRQPANQPRRPEQLRPVPAVPAPLANDFWRKAAQNPAPWRQAHPNGKGTRELVLDPQMNRAVIREDADGDGRFEREEFLPLGRN